MSTWPVVSAEKTTPEIRPSPARKRATESLPRVLPIDSAQSYFASSKHPAESTSRQSSTSHIPDVPSDEDSHIHEVLTQNLREAFQKLEIKGPMENRFHGKVCADIASFIPKKA